MYDLIPYRKMARWVSDIKIRAERKCGEMLKATAKSGERARAGGNRGSIVTRCNNGNKPTLTDIGIERINAYRYQKLADIPEEVFESALEAIEIRLLHDATIEINPPSALLGSSCSKLPKMAEFVILQFSPKSAKTRLTPWCLWAPNQKIQDSAPNLEFRPGKERWIGGFLVACNKWTRRYGRYGRRENSPGKGR